MEKLKNKLMLLKQAKLKKREEEDNEDIKQNEINLNENNINNDNELLNKKIKEDKDLSENLGDNNKKRKMNENENEEDQIKLTSKEEDELNDIFQLEIDHTKLIKITKKENLEIKSVDSGAFENSIKSRELYNWLYIIFAEWEKYIEDGVNSTTFNNKGNLKLMTEELEVYKECYRNIEPLLLSLRDQKLTQFILDKLFQIMIFARNSDYIKAHDSYIELSIGNAPWPMGVTMVGIHERIGRSRISTSQIAYILNDDTTKKYLQSFKRVLTFIQKEKPKHPSESVFN